MKRRVRIGASAAAELSEAVRWHEEKRAGLGAELRDLVGMAIDRVREHPGSGSIVPSASGPPLRRRLIPRFPFQIIYYPHHDEIVVVAIAHMSRRPDYWMKRLGST